MHHISKAAMSSFEAWGALAYIVSTIVVYNIPVRKTFVSLFLIFLFIGSIALLHYLNKGCFAMALLGAIAGSIWKFGLSKKTSPKKG